MKMKSYGEAVMCLILAVLLVPLSMTYAEKMLSLPATVDAIDLNANSMKVTYTDLDTDTVRHQDVYWDGSTEFIREGPPPDIKESPAKAADIKKGSRLYIRIVEGGQKMGKFRLDAVRIKP